MASAKKSAKKAVKKSSVSTTKAAVEKVLSSQTFPVAPSEAPNSPTNYRARVRMYRHGLGDCFLLTFPRKGREPFQMLIDCGVLGRDKDFMTGMVKHIRDTVWGGDAAKKARLDVVVATHEHKDHLSGFNQAREVFDDDFEFGAVWLSWTENLTQGEVKKIKEAKKKAVEVLKLALASPNGAAIAEVTELLGFSVEDGSLGTRSIAEALEYLKLRGKDTGGPRYLEPGQGPIVLDDVEGVRVYVLGPPLDPVLLKGSEVTEKLKRDGVIYHLAATGNAGLDALEATVRNASDEEGELYCPFTEEHRISRQSAYFPAIEAFVRATYDNPVEAWRKVDTDWTRAFGQLALDLDNDTNNTSLVLAFEFVATGEVLLFVGDAQVGSWLSWENVEFTVPGRASALTAHELLSRTVFYKVGHHCSHNATIALGGLELMNGGDLVAFIPLDRETAKKQGKKGWDMPAEPLFKAICKKASRRVVISDIAESLCAEAKAAGVLATEAYVDYFLK